MLSAIRLCACWCDIRRRFRPFGLFVFRLPLAMFLSLYNGTSFENIGTAHNHRREFVRLIAVAITIRTCSQPLLLVLAAACLQ